jgi:hypothetical protein
VPQPALASASTIKKVQLDEGRSGNLRDLMGESPFVSSCPGPLGTT